MPGDRIALVTGTSSGIGTAVANLLLARGWTVLGVARRTPALGSERYRHLALDLSHAAAAAALEREALPLLRSRGWERVGLVNNAAVGMAARAQLLDANGLEPLFTLNTAVPLWLMGFLARERPEQVPLRVVNVSSGAAVRAFPGLSAYCASKAALRMAGMAVAAEGLQRLAILSYEPGVVDTEMQTATRSKTRDEFPWVETFQRYHAEGALVRPELPARDIVAFLESDEPGPFVERRRV